MHACMASGEDEADDGALEERFKRAAERMRQNTALVLANEQKLELYGFYKQVLFSLQSIELCTSTCSSSIMFCV